MTNQTLPSTESQSATAAKTAADKAMKEWFIHSGTLWGVNDGAPEVVRALTTVLFHWIKTDYRQLVRTESDEDLPFHDQVVKGTLDAIDFIVKVSDCYDTARSWKETAEEEVSNGN